MHIAHSHIILDACCVLNFCASGKLLEILKSIPAKVAVTQVVQEDPLPVRSLFIEDGRSRQTISGQSHFFNRPHHPFRFYQPQKLLNIGQKKLVLIRQNYVIYST